MFSHLLTSVARENSTVAGRLFERRSGALAESRIAPQLIDALLRHQYSLHLRELTRLMWVALSTSPDGLGAVWKVPGPCPDGLGAV